MPDGSPSAGLTDPADDLAARIRADWDTIESRRRMVNETLTELAGRMEAIADSLLLPPDDAIEAARLDAARYAWLAAAGMVREGIVDA